VHVCSASGGLELKLPNHKLQAKLEMMMTPKLRTLVSEALGQIHGKAGAALVQTHENAYSANVTTSPLPTMPVVETEVIEDPRQQQQPLTDDCCGPTGGGIASKCVDGEPNCGLLHDTMAQYWGKYKDLVDELEAKMEKEEDDHEGLSHNLNEQLTVITDRKTAAEEDLAESIKQIDTDEEEKGVKEEQGRDLAHEYIKTCKAYKKKITEILFTNICAVKKVRNELLESSTISPPSKIFDCDVSDWRDDGKCSVDCDDSCPDADPYKCGGMKPIARTLLQEPNEFGFKCPIMESNMKCNQKKCPVDCKVSDWSGFSACSKECGGGMREETRSIMDKPKNGGVSCPGVVASEPCNTKNCDRECDLSEWTEWSPCSMACTPKDMGTPVGSRTRVKTVKRKVRANGYCPTPGSRARLDTDPCNTHSCVGDEICIAKQDLIIAVDGSGSLKEEGFEVLRDFAANLTSRYKAEYFGDSAMKVGLVEFGNGKLLDSGAIEPALNIMDMSTDMDAAKEKIQGMTWQKGFTNIAQVFLLADNMVQRGGRADAQSAILLVTDGKIPFMHETKEKATKLKDKGFNVMLAVVSDALSVDMTKDIKELASLPLDTNFVHIPGLQALKYNPEEFTQQVTATFCPDSMSPSLQDQRDENRGYMLIRERGYPSDECGTWVDIGYMNLEDCAEAAQKIGQACFAFGRGWQTPKAAVQHCYGEAITVTEENWMLFKKDRAMPPCPNGVWHDNPYYDVYCFDPAI